MEVKLPNVKQTTTKSKEIALVSPCLSDILDVSPLVRSSGFDPESEKFLLMKSRILGFGI